MPRKFVVTKKKEKKRAAKKKSKGKEAKATKTKTQEVKSKGTAEEGEVSTDVVETKISNKPVNPDGTKNLAKHLKKLNDKFGEGTIALAKDVRAVTIRRIPTCSFAHDVVMGGGTYMGGIIEITGPNQCGKTWWCIKNIAVNQRLCNRCNTPFKIEGNKRICPSCGDYEERVCAFLDAENSALSALSKEGWISFKGGDAKKKQSVLMKFFIEMGVDISRLLYHRPRDSEEGYQILDDLITQKIANFIVYDSIAASLTGEEMSKQFTEHSMAVKARMNNKLVRKIVTRFNEGSLTDENNIAWCCLMLINQLSTDLRMVKVFADNNLKATGGLGVGYMALERLKFKNPERLKHNKKFVGFSTNVEIYKDKQGLPFNWFNFNIYTQDIPSLGIKKYQIDENSEIFDVGLQCDVFGQSGGWFKYKGHKFQGKEKLYAWLLKNKRHFKEIKSQLLKKE